MRELCNRSRTSERPRGRPELLPRARGGRNCSTRGSGNQVQAVQRPLPRPVMLGSVLSLAAGEATRFRLSSSSVSVTFLRLAQVYQVQDSPSTKTKIQVTSFSANFRGAIQPSKRTFAQTAVAEKTGRSLHRRTSDVAVVVFALPAGGKLCTCQLHCNGHILMMPKRGARGRQHFSCPNSDNSDSEWGLDLISRRSQPKMGHTLELDGWRVD